MTCMRHAVSGADAPNENVTDVLKSIAAPGSKPGPLATGGSDVQSSHWGLKVDPDWTANTNRSRSTG